MSGAVSRSGADVPDLDELRVVCQPPEVLGRRNAEHWAGRRARRISIHVTRWAIRRGWSADAMTVVMFGVGVLGAAAFFLPGPVAAVAGALLIQLHLVLDCSDGEIARWRGVSSVRGIYLDRLAHYVTEATLFTALGYRAGSGDAGWLGVGLLTALLVILIKAETDLVDVARARAGLVAADDAATEITSEPLAAGRRIAAVVPIHRVLGAVEGSLLIAVAALIDAGIGELRVTRGMAVLVLGVAAAVLVLHLVSILASRRLAP